MTTQYTTILKLALPVQGELSGTWGDVVNDNITQMVEQAVAGKAVINTWTGNSHTLTTADGTTSESRCAILELTDSGTALTGAGTVVCPTNTKLYIVDNNTAEIITVQTAAGTGVAVPVGKTMLVYCDGTNVVEGVTHANSLSLGTSTVTADKILDEDNMASDSATAIATQQSIKAYVDSQVGTVDTLSEILANGNTTGANDIDVDSAQKVQFRDADIYLNSSVDGQLDIVADTEIQIAATTVDLNGNLDVSGTALVAGVLTTTAATVFNGGFASNADSTLGTDKKVQFRDAAIYLNSSVDGQLDIVADGEVQIDTALVDINGNLDVSGTTNISGSVSFTKNAIAGVAISTTSRSSNTVTVTTSAVHGLTSGDLVNVNGVADTSFNGYFTVSVSSTTVFTYSQTGADGSSTGGTSTEVVYNLNASGTALNWMNGPLNIAANSGIDGLEITQSGSGEALSITGGNAIFGDNDKAVFGAGSDLQIYHDGTDSFISDQGTGNLKLLANDFRLANAANNELMLKADQSSAVTAYYAGAEKLATTSTGIDVTGTVTATGTSVFASLDISGDIDVDGTTNLDIVDIDGAVDMASTLGVTGLITGTTATFTRLEINATNTKLKGDLFANTDAAFDIGASGANRPRNLYLSNSITAADITTTGNGTFNRVIVADGILDTGQAGSATVFNESGSTADFRVESDASANMLFVDGGANVVGIATASPATYVGSGGLAIKGATVSDLSLVSTGIASGVNSHQMRYWNDTGTAYEIARTRVNVGAGQVNRGEYQFSVNNGGGLRQWLDVDYGGNVTFNEGGHDSDFRVESDTNANMLFVDGGESAVGIGTATQYDGTALVSPLTISSLSGGNVLETFRGSASLFQLTMSTTGISSWNTSGSAAAHSFRTGTTVGTTSIKMYLGATGGLTMTPEAGGHTVFNEDGIDANFRVESSGNANMLFVDGGDNTVSVGGSTSLGILSVISGVDGTEAAPHFAIQGAASNYRLNMWLDATAAYIGQDSAIREVRIYSGAETAGVALTAGATSWSTFSDERLKENVEPVENALQSLSGLRTVKYHLKDVDGPEDKKKIGVIAQDLVGVLDEVIDPTFRPGDDTEYMGVRYTELVPVLIKAIQEQQNLIESLESRITALES
jgi:hypothetical protein